MKLRALKNSILKRERQFLSQKFHNLTQNMKIK